MHGNRRKGAEVNREYFISITPNPEEPHREIIIYCSQPPVPANTWSANTVLSSSNSSDLSDRAGGDIFCSSVWFLTLVPDTELLNHWNFLGDRRCSSEVTLCGLL